MRKIGLSIIIPLYNAKDWIVPTINCLVDSLELADFDAEIIVIDDGSKDGSAEMTQTARIPNNVTFKLIKQANTGRYLARKRGVDASSKQNILFVDSRVFVDKGSLPFLYEKLKDNTDQLWNGHVNIDKKGNIFARFWDAIVCIAWRKYFRRPRTTNYGIKDFDYYPKGTGFFYVPKKRLLAAMDYFEKTTNDIRNSSDDTLLIRYMNERQDIHLSPEFSCLYHGRSSLKGFLKHAYGRGRFFIDGFLRPGTRFFVPLIAILALSVFVVVALVAWPMLTAQVLVVGALLLVAGLFIGALILGVTVADSFALALLGVPFSIVYLAGLWRGVSRRLVR